MATYVVYQCSICRRKKSILRDDIRAAPNLCIITKGCSGQLLKVTETLAQQSTPTVQGLTDWFARGKEVIVSETEPLLQVSLLTSSSSLTIGAEFGSAPDIVVAKFLQLRPDDVAFQQFTFRLATSTTELPSSTSTKDIYGKVMRFDQAAIDEGRVRVRVNGVLLEDDALLLEVNKVKFTPAIDAGAVVDVLVYSEVTTIERDIMFNKNTAATVAMAGDAWKNISKATVPGYNPLTIYTSEPVTNLPASKMKLMGFTDRSGVALTAPPPLFLLASSPYESVDRYLNFCVPSTMMMQAFDVEIFQSSKFDFLVPLQHVQELYPAITLQPLATASSSFIIADTFTTTGSIPVDTSLVRLSGKKIIGPV